MFDCQQCHLSNNQLHKAVPELSARSLPKVPGSEDRTLPERLESEWIPINGDQKSCVAPDGGIE